MQVQKRWKRFVIAFLSLIFGGFVCAVFLFGTQARAQQPETPTEKIRVVLTNYDDTGYVDNSQYGIKGYYVEYLNQIAKYTGWEYDIRAISDEEELLSIVNERDYDIMVGVDYTEERERKMFDYPSENIGNRHLVVAASKTHPSLVSNDISQLQGIKVGITDSDLNQALKEKFISFCFSNGIKCRENVEGDFPQGVTLVTVPEEKRFEMVETGEVDAVLCSDSRALENNLFVVAEFGKTAIYTVVPKGNDSLLSALNAALESIDRIDSDFAKRLYDKYFAANDVNVLAFTGEELEYLEADREFQVAMWDDCAPYGYLNDNGDWSGIAIEIFDEITRMTNGKIIFRIVGFNSSQEAQEAMQLGEVDILGQTFAAFVTSKNGESRSRSYYSDNFYMYRCKNSNKGIEDAKIVVKQDFPISLLRDIGVGDIQSVIRVDSVVEALQAVNSGEADLTFALQNVADYYINYYQFTKIVEIGMQMNAVSFCCVYGEQMDSIAKNICNKCISHINNDTLNRRITEYILADHKEITIFDYIKSNWGFFALWGIGLMAVVIALLIAMIITISNKTKRIYRVLYQDEITGGSSYLKFEENAVKMLQEESSCYIFFADIQSFKYINDVYGYIIGNRVLCVVASFMKKLAEGCPVARMYADHFVAIRAYQEKEALEKQLRALLEKFDEECRREFKDFNVLLKVGVYYRRVSSGSEIRQMVNLANYAADNIVNSSKSEYRFYSMEMHDKVLARQHIEKDMHRAMAEGEFIAYYQPKFDIVTNEIIGAEALVRWNHKERGLISPGSFIPIFESDRFIIEVDFCVFEQVCRLLAERMENNRKLYTISCNFSRLHFPQRDFLDRLMAIVDKYQVPTAFIEIEITETVATSDFDLLIGTVQKLKEKGFKISIDDFGSGYSCIQLLYKLPIDVLKMDRVFVCGQDVNKKEEDINKSILHVCHTHDIKVICEGVETQQQKEFIESYGCRYVQGFLYSKPVCREEFLAMLDE